MKVRLSDRALKCKFILRVTHTAVIQLGLAHEEAIDIFEGDEGQFCAGYLNNTAVEFDRYAGLQGVRIFSTDGTAEGMGMAIDKASHYHDLNYFCSWCGLFRN